jgi:hypothetical protein
MSGDGDVDDFHRGLCTVSNQSDQLHFNESVADYNGKGTLGNFEGSSYLEPYSRAFYQWDFRLNCLVQRRTRRAVTTTRSGEFLLQARNNGGKESRE